MDPFLPRKDDFEDSPINEIILCYQEDPGLFKRGQLLNIGMQYARGSILIFQDVDIRHRSPIDFTEALGRLSQENLGLLGFNRITQTEETTEGFRELESSVRNGAFGGCNIFLKWNFMKSFGFSNLPKGWGAEDNILQIRSRMGILDNDLLHIKHESVDRETIKPKRWYQLNIENYLSSISRPPSLDGYRQTQADIIIKNDSKATHIYCSNIRVPPNFLYKDLIYQESSIAQFPEEEPLSRSLERRDMSIKFSIITPFFNREAFLPAVIQSVLKQTRDDWELLLCDDGSTDDSIKSISKFPGDPRLKLLRTGGRFGPARARNLCLEQIKGDYVIFVDSDDVIEPDLLETANNFFEENPQIDCVTTIFEDEVNGYFEPLYKCKIRRHIIDGLSQDALSKESLEQAFNEDKNPLLLLCPTFFRRRVFDSIRFNEDLLVGEDQWLLKEIYKAGFQFDVLEKLTYHYRIHGKNLHQTGHRLAKEEVLKSL